MCIRDRTQHAPLTSRVRKFGSTSEGAAMTSDVVQGPWPPPRREFHAQTCGEAPRPQMRGGLSRGADAKPSEPVFSLAPKGANEGEPTSCRRVSGLPASEQMRPRREPRQFLK